MPFIPNNKISKCFFLIILTSYLVFFSHKLLASNHFNQKIDNKKEELKQVTRQIQGLENALREDNHHKTNIQIELKTIAAQVGNLTLSVSETDSKIKAQETTLNKLYAKENTLKQALKNQLQSLTLEIRAAYLLTQNHYLKLIFSQENPNEINRLLIYVKYINGARLNSLNDLKKTVQKLEKTRVQIIEQTQHLKFLKNRDYLSKNTFTHVLHKRQQSLSAIQNSITYKTKTLASLVADKEALASLIKKLSSESMNYVPARASLASNKGKLKWPILGHLIQGFGMFIPGTHMIANNVLIEAPKGTPVHAIYPGKIVFSDWIRGVGKLIIIDHGQGFMSLYGHNQTLLKKTGDFVTTGSVIATVGQTGDADQSGLYFQLRSNGKPLDPRFWCK